MWRAYLTKFILKIRFNNHLLERLRGSRKLREVCGFGEEVPSESTLSRFVSRLADHQDLVEQCLVNVTGELRDLVPAVKQREGRQDQPLPPLGAVLAIDSTLFETYGNPNRRTSTIPSAIPTPIGVSRTAQRPRTARKNGDSGTRCTWSPTPPTAFP